VALVILDRDGVVNEESDDFIRSVDEWVPIPGSIEAIVDLSRAGYRVAIATNQSGLGRGLFSAEDLQAIHTRLCQMVEGRGGSIAGIFYCPHTPDEGCACRKPATGLLSAIEDTLGESASGAAFIGDSLRDLQAARAFNCAAMLVRTGRGRATLAALQSGGAKLEAWEALQVFDDLAAAARSILRGV
jgi:D-glycero-D-manno-heptose 1,7-bisphosphate phosphatase